MLERLTKKRRVTSSETLKECHCDAADCRGYLPKN